MVQLIGNRSRQRRHLVVRGRVGNPGWRGECGLVRVRPQPRLLLAGRPIECCVRRPRVGNGGQARCRAFACRRQDIRRLWEDRARRRLDGGGCRIQNRRGDRIGAPGFDFDAAVTGAGIERQSCARTCKQEEGEAKVNDDGRCCDNADRDEVEQGAKVRLWCPDALIRKIGGRTRRFGGLWTRVSGGGLFCQLVEHLLSERSAGISRSPFPGKTLQIPYQRRMATGRRPFSSSKPELRVSVLVARLPAGPLAAREAPAAGRPLAPA
jgi:hypothetical protein